MANDLLIKINADAKNVTKAYDDIKSQTEDLENTLAKVAQVSAVAFAAFTAEIFFSVKAFEEAERASVQLSNALQNQGIYTEQLAEEYKSYAEAVQAKTGIDDDAIVKAQAVAQGYLGQTKITGELTQAIADLSATMGGDLDGAAEKIARTIGTGTNAFARQGLVISESATEAERYAKVLEFVNLKAGGLAEEFNKADGYTKALATSFGNFQEAIGSRFAPIVATLRQTFISLFDYLRSNPAFLDIAASLIAAGAAVSGLVAAAAVLVPAVLSVAAALAALELSAAAVLIPIGLTIAAIGALVAVAVFLGLNWDKTMAGLKAAAVAAVTLISELFTGLGQVLQGALELDTSKIQQGLETLRGSFAKAKNEAVTTYTEIREAQEVEGQKQNEQKAALAAKAEADEKQHQANLRAIRAAEIEILKLQNENASQELIALKQKEIETLKALDEQKSAEEIRLLNERLEIIHAREDEQQAQDLARQQEFAAAQAEVKAELAQQGIDADAALTDQRIAQLQATAQTELDIERKLQEDLLTKKIATNNQFLLEQKKYGVAYATINRAIQSDEVQGAKTASSELVELSQSKNETLKGIGKAASIAQITMKTAEAAMNIYNGFSIIPIVGPALGVAGAAAAIAFGAEKISAVTAAADGGLIEGGISGRDSVPALLMPGELVVPRKSYSDVVDTMNGDKGGNSDPQMLELLQSINDKISTPQTTIIQGDVTTDDSYVDALVRRISDAIQYRNGQIFGVTA